MRDRCPSEEVLSARLDGATGSTTTRRVDAHVAGCQHCAAALDGLAGVRGALRSLPLRQVPAEVVDGAVPAAMVAVQRQEHRARVALVAAAVTLTVLGGAIVDQQIQGEGVLQALEQEEIVRTAGGTMLAPRTDDQPPPADTAQER